jgi:multiple sugar transport system substrate-binding protein
LKRDLNGDGYTDQWVGVTDIRARWRDRLFDFYPFYIAASGGKTLIENGQIAFDNPVAVKVFEFFSTLFQKGFFPRELTTGRRDFFLYGMAGSRITGPWEIPRTEKFKPEGFEYDFCHVPVPDSTEGPFYTYGNPKSIVIFRNTKNPEKAWEFVKFMISRDNDLKLLSVANQLPVRKKLLEESAFSSYFDKNPKMITFVRQAEYIRNEDSCPSLKDILDAISQEFEACVVYGAKTPLKAVHDAADRARLVLE